MKNKKKGFTLIELLAVILILGIIALIAIPTVTNIIKESKRGAFKSGVQNIINAVETECQLEQMRGEELTTSYSFSNGQVDNELNIKGDLPQSGTITVDSSCNVEVDVTDGTFTATKSSDSDEIVISEAGKSNVPTPVSFAEDSWETIVANVKAGNLSAYNVGDTKEIALTGFTNAETDSNGLYTIRIANVSTPEECNAEGFSQTACGFVIEFEDIITTEIMDSTNNNAGGWAYIYLRTYVNDTIYNSLPAELKESIISTKVISGSGRMSEGEICTATDKLYLLSRQEILGDNSDYDTASALTRQLDYYVNKGVTSSNYANAIKKLNGSENDWWLRSAPSYLSIPFDYVSNTGEVSYTQTDEEHGIAVAFRI